MPHRSLHPLARLARLALCCLLCLLASCSWAFSRPPKPPVRAASGEVISICDPNRAPPTLDTLNAASAGLLALIMVAKSDEMQNDYGMSEMFAIGGALQLLVYGASASYGFRQARACEQQKRDLAVAQPSEPVPYVPTPWPAPTSMPPPPPAPPPPVIEHVEQIEEEEQTKRTTRVRSRTIVQPRE